VRLADRDVTAIGDHQRVKHANSHDFSGLCETFGYVAIFPARGRIPARVIVRVMWQGPLCGGSH
jgi:hypothetical protein